MSILDKMTCRPESPKPLQVASAFKRAIDKATHGLVSAPARNLFASPALPALVFPLTVSATSGLLAAGSVALSLNVPVFSPMFLTAFSITNLALAATMAGGLPLGLAAIAAVLGVYTLVATKLLCVVVHLPTMLALGGLGAATSIFTEVLYRQIEAVCIADKRGRPEPIAKIISVVALAAIVLKVSQQKGVINMNTWPRPFSDIAPWL